MELIIIFSILLIAVVGIVWGSAAFFINLDRKAGTPISGHIIVLGVLVGLIAAIFMMKFMWSKEPGGWGYGSFNNVILFVVSPMLTLLGFWVVLGAGCLVKAAMPNCRPIRNQAIGRAVLFWIIPGFIGIAQVSAVMIRNSLETKAKNWVDFIVDGRTDPTAEELHEIKNSPEIQSLLIASITWGSNDYAAAWKFFWEPLAAKSPQNYRDLLLRHGTDAAQIREASKMTEKWYRGSFRLIQDNPSFKQSPLATELMAAASADRSGRTDERIKNDLEHSLGSWRTQLLEPYWQLRQWDRLASYGNSGFEPDAFRQWLRSPENTGLREDLKIRIHSESFEVRELIDPQILATLVADGGLEARVAVMIGARVPWSEQDWHQFLACPPDNSMMDRYQDWIDALGGSYLQIPSPLLFVSTGNPDFNKAAKIILKVGYRDILINQWKLKNQRH